MLRVILALVSVAFLASCGTGESVWASDERIKQVMYRDSGPAKLTLFTMVSNSTGSGAHTSLMINGSQRVIFDPAGSFKHPSIPERNDVVYGITPQIADVYTRYHARETYHVVVQELEVSAEVAEVLLQRAMAYGAVSKAHCTNSTSSILKGVPGFENIRVTYFPNNLAKQFGALPGVTEQALYEYDADDNSRVLRQWVPQEG